MDKYETTQTEWWTVIERRRAFAPPAGTGFHVFMERRGPWSHKTDAENAARKARMDYPDREKIRITVQAHTEDRPDLPKDKPENESVAE